MGPVTNAGAIAQSLAETMAGCALTQLERPGAPVIFGNFLSSMSLRSGSPTFGTPEPAIGSMVIGQLARRLKLPLRCSGNFTTSKLPDAHALNEGTMSMLAAVHCGANFILHSAGFLDGLLSLSYEKFVMDAEFCGALHTFSMASSWTTTTALDAFREVGPAATSSAAPTRCRTTRRPSGIRTSPTTSPSRSGSCRIGRRCRPRQLGAGRRRLNEICRAAARPRHRRGDARIHERHRKARNGGRMVLRRRISEGASMRFVLTLILSTIALPALAGPASDAVRFFYAPDVNDLDPANRSRFTDPALAKLAEYDTSSSDGTEVGCIDWVLALDAQDFDDAELAKSLSSTRMSRATRRPSPPVPHVCGRCQQPRNHMDMAKWAAPGRCRRRSPRASDWRLSALDCSN